MANVVLTIDPPQTTKESCLEVFDQEIAKFSKYMAELKSPAAGALNSPEKALLKTFLVFMYKETQQNGSL